MKLEKSSKSYSDLNCIEANYKSNKRFYFLNIEPGQYTIVAGKFGYYRTQSKSPRYNFSMVFDKESREKMKFTVKESELINLGEFLMDESAVSFDQDPDLGRIGEKIFPGFKNNFGKNVQMTMTPGLYQALELPAIGKTFNHDNRPEKLEEIRNEVKEDFSGTEWKIFVK
ncbi:MAG TPA: hypothetical protein PK079_21335 [Leptospiraceae bacterium]|nr:hypothetical protein [Leptospiraceae bacterium]HMW07503.1 hypothetical protein [Leptospiraceae bacterium]HMY33103.1 hypothetical protein [Leptospiraceae bacterium]HMZ64228.1 hypothetical protein [Leptospiraceae bacterium]HNA10330.1 hypothetical protein [Leptospiraceae bacterium]